MLIKAGVDMQCFLIGFWVGFLIATCLIDCALFYRGVKC